MTDGFTIHIIPEAYPGTGLRLPLGSLVPKPTGGNARWSKVPRPRRRDMTEFDGENLVQQVISVMLDEGEGGDIEPLARRIRGWMARGPLPFEPTVLRLEGPVQYADLPYVLEDVEDMEEVQTRLDGVRWRQELKLDLLEYNPGSLLVQKPVSPVEVAQQKAAQKPATKLDRLSLAAQQWANRTSRTYTVKRTDHSLANIAARELGDANKWKFIADLNDIRDPNAIRVGQVLRLP